MADLTKTCATCGETKPISAFNPVDGGRLGVRGSCKACQRMAETDIRRKAQQRYYRRIRCDSEKYASLLARKRDAQRARRSAKREAVPE